MGGVGKTTLLTKVNNKLGNSAHSFDVVIWVVVSQNADITKIQNAIGNKVGLPDDGNRSREDKAIDIFRVLSTKRFVLFLDDLWERLDLSRMGIPHPDNQNKSKVVFTTRSKDLYGRMEAHRKIEVKCLAWDNAWDLFQKKVGEDALDAHLEIPQLAKTMAKECGGLPLALVTIGRAMASKTTLQEWCHAIAVLKKSAAEFSGMGDEVFPLLKFSYDSLPSNTIRSCFLYCCLFPEDYFIPKEQLIEYWFGEGFLDRSEELNGVQNHGHDIIGTLIRACLLEEEDGGNKMKMHDVIRDMGMWISCECGKANDKLLVQAGAGLKKAPQFEKWERVEKMSLMRNGIEELTETPSCLNLSTLLLSFNNLKVISHGFFQTMPKLRVLDLSLNWNLKELPAEISELTTLQYLNLSHTSIREFSVELKNLVGLKFLSLEDTNKLSRISLGILSSFKKLRVLKMLGCGSSYVTEEGVLEEVKGLKELNRLGISIRSVSALSHFLNSPNLLRYTRELGMENIQGLLDMYSIIVHASCVERLRIKRCEDLIFELPGKGVEDSNTLSPQPCFHHLCDIRISKCRILKDLTWLVYAPNLKYLKVEYCERMEEIVSGGEMARDEEYLINQVFPQLQALYLRELPHLKSIYPNALPCSCLNLIQVFGCRELKKLPLNSNSAKGCQIQIRGDGEWWDGLEWEDEATRDAFLPSHTPYETSAM